MHTIIAIRWYRFTPYGLAAVGGNDCRRSLHRQQGDFCRKPLLAFRTLYDWSGKRTELFSFLDSGIIFIRSYFCDPQLSVP